MTEWPAVLFLDTASPVSSVAIGRHGNVLAQRTIKQRRTSELLLPTIEDVLAAADVEIETLHGIATLQGPGSFTGLRIGLATALGLHQALQLRATALPTLPILAAAASDGDHDSGDVLAAVDANRGDWVVQRFRVGNNGDSRATTPISEPTLINRESLGDGGPCRIVGFGTGVLRECSWFHDAEIELIDPPPLAAIAARRLAAESIAWRPERLVAPIYFRPPAVTAPKR